MQTPKIKIDGKEHKAQKKMRLFRLFLRLSRSDADMESDEGIDELLEFIAACFPGEEVTAEKIEEQLDIDEVFGLFEQLGRWVMNTVQQKTGEIPNGQGGES